MGYTPGKIWSTGDTLTASDMQGNFDGIKKFNHDVGLTSLQTAQWVDTKHIMPGVIDAQTNVTYNCSGVFGGQQQSYQSLNYTFLTRWNTTRSSASLENLIVPETSFTLQLRRPATVFFQWWINTKSRYDGNARGMTTVGVFKDKPVPDASMTNAQVGYENYIPSQTQATKINLAGNFDTGVYISGVKYNTGFAMLEGAQSIPFAIGLQGRSYNGQCEILSWGISAEVFYI